MFISFLLNCSWLTDKYCERSFPVGLMLLPSMNKHCRFLMSQYFQCFLLVYGYCAYGCQLPLSQTDRWRNPLQLSGFGLLVRTFRFLSFPAARLRLYSSQTTFDIRSCDRVKLVAFTFQRLWHLTTVPICHSLRLAALRALMVTLSKRVQPPGPHWLT